MVVFLLYLFHSIFHVISTTRTNFIDSLKIHQGALIFVIQYIYSTLNIHLMLFVFLFQDLLFICIFVYYLKVILSISHNDQNDIILN